jgi:hypothetical protein
MPNKPQYEHKTVSLEALLRLKRHEKPDSRFWDSFQAELHQKTLATLVRRESGLAILLKRAFLRLAPGLPLAAAALFVTALYVQDHFLPHSHELNGTEIAAAEILPYDILSLAEAAGVPEFDIAESSARYVVGAMNSRDASNDRGFTEVPASNRISASFNSRVQFVSGGLAASTIGKGSSTSVY